MRCLATGLALFWLGGILAAEPLPTDTISERVLRYEAGIICAVAPDRVDEAPGTVSGTKHVIENRPPFVSQTRQVPAVLGVGFGVAAQARDLLGEPGATMFVSHPAFPGSGATVQSFVTRLPGDAPGITFYQFDYDYELVTGLWTLTTVDAGGEVLFSVSFQVVPPETVPELAEACNFVELLS